MNLRDAGNIRAFSLILYLLFSLLLTAVILISGRFSHISFAEAL